MVAEHGATTAGQHRGEAPSLLGKAGVTDGVDTAVEAMKPAVGVRPIDRAPGVAEGAGQLTYGDDAVLAFRQVCEWLMWVRSSFVPHMGQKDERAWGSSPRDRGFYAGREETKRSKAAMSVTAGPWPGRIREGLSSASLRIERRFSAGS